MYTDAPSTRSRLITNAARLFRTKGYHGTGLTELLSDSRAPKGSLYHHFPNGKADLALATANYVSAGMLQVIDQAFQGVDRFQTGATTFCYKLAKLFDQGAEYRSCPITAILFDAPENEDFRQQADEILSAWADRVTDYGIKLGHPTPRATSTMLLLAIQGGWTVARAKNSSDILREIPVLLFGEALTK